MRFVSLFSGTEAASVAWEPLGWTPVAFAEIEPFPSAVLAHHFPDVPNLGDVTKVDWSPYAGVDVLVGGSPCQSFSVAGLRKGLDDPRGNLMLEYLRAVDHVRPRWVVWENVPGVLSADGGRAFGTFLGGLAELGYGFAYRVLDAQFVRVQSFPRAVPQRRRRVFVVGRLGDWRRAAAVLLERESLCGHPAPRREAGEGVAALTATGVGASGADDNQGQAGHLIPEGVSDNAYTPTHHGPTESMSVPVLSSTDRPTRQGVSSQSPFVPEVSNALCSNDYKGSKADKGLGAPLISEVAHSLRADGFDAGEDGTGRGTPLVAFTCKDSGQDAGEVSPTLRSMNDNGVPNGGGQVAIAQAFAENQRGELRTSDVAMSLSCAGGKPGSGYPAVQQGYAVRRLTPLECERLQGFPDAWTDVPYRGKKAADGPRYKAIGNSMAINAMSFIGERIACVEAL